MNLSNISIPLKGNHIRRLTISGGSSSAYLNAKSNASEIVIEKDWYNSDWQFCFIRPKELGAGFKTDWIVYYVNMNLFAEKIKSKKHTFNEWIKLCQKN